MTKNLTVPVGPDFLIEGYEQPPHYSDNQAVVVRLIPPRETVTDPRRLESFFSELASAIAQFSGQPQLAGGRLLSNRSTRAETQQRQIRRAVLARHMPQTNSGQSSANFHPKTQGEISQIERPKKLTQNYSANWSQALSLELVGSFERVTFLLRANNRPVLELALEQLRHYYPRLEVEELKGDAQAARQIGRLLARSGPGSAEWNKFDPMLFADDRAAQLTTCRWLMLSEDPVMPLETGFNNGQFFNPLRPVLAALGNLKAGEGLVSQLLVYGPLAKEWALHQETRANQLKTPRNWPPSARSANPQRPKTTGPRSENRAFYRAEGQSNSNGLSLGLVGLGLGVGLLIMSWNWLQEAFLKPFERGEFAEGLRGGLIGLGAGCLIIFLLLASWWIFRGSGRGDEIISSVNIETKLARPLLLVSLRLVVSVPLEPYLAEVIFNPAYSKHFQEPERHKRARQLYRLRQRLLSVSDKPLQSNEQNLKFKAGDHDIWDMTQELAEILATERNEQLLNTLASSYSVYQSGSGNAFLVAPPRQPIEVFSSLQSYDWPGPERLRAGLLANLWPFNSRLFDTLANFANRRLPAELLRWPCLMILNSTEAAQLWYLPGGTEIYDYLERSGPKEIGLDPALYDLTRPSSVERETNYWADPAAGLNAEELFNK